MAEPLPPDPELERFYAADRRIPALDPDASARILARVQGVAAAVGPASAATSGIRAVTRLVSAKTAAAIAIASFIGGAATGATIVALTRDAPTPPSRAPIEVAPVEPPPAPTPTTTELEPEPPVEPALAVAPAPPSRAGESSLAAERRLLEAARAALARDRGDHADAILARHAQRFPEGELAEERESLRVEAAFAAGDWDRVESLATAFLADRPGSLYRSRVERLQADARERAHAIGAGNDRSSPQHTNEGEPAPGGSARRGGNP